MVMLFGMKNIPSYFQQVMNLLLRDLVEVYVLLYLDNMLIYLAIDEDHTGM